MLKYGFTFYSFELSSESRELLALILFEDVVCDPRCLIHLTYTMWSKLPVGLWPVQILTFWASVLSDLVTPGLLLWLHYHCCAWIWCALSSSTNQRLSEFRAFVPSLSRPARIVRSTPISTLLRTWGTHPISFLHGPASPDLSNTLFRSQRISHISTSMLISGITPF